jgi:hypothetical protein
MSPKADRFLVGALLGDSSACLLAFSLDFLRSEAITFEFVVFPLPTMLSYKKWTRFKRIKSCLIVHAASTRRSSSFEMNFKTPAKHFVYKPLHSQDSKWEEYVEISSWSMAWTKSVESVDFGWLFLTTSSRTLHESNVCSNLLLPAFKCLNLIG